MKNPNLCALQQSCLRADGLMRGFTDHLTQDTHEAISAMPETAEEMFASPANDAVELIEFSAEKRQGLIEALRARAMCDGCSLRPLLKELEG